MGTAPRHPAPVDEVLFLRYRERRDLKAFSQLYDRYATPLYRFLVRFMRDETAAEDVAQQAFLRVHEWRDSFDERRFFRVWIFTIARRLALNWLERHGTGEAAATTEALVDPMPSPERRAIARDDARSLERALRALSRDDAEVLLLARYEDLSYEEIGEVVGCSPDAAKMRVHRALKRLAERVAADQRAAGRGAVES